MSSKRSTTTLDAGTYTGSLQDFVLDQKRQACPVCALQPEVREMLKDERYTLDIKVRFVEARCGTKLTHAQLLAHRSQRHDP